MRLILTRLLALGLLSLIQAANALTACPSSHFVPVYRFGQAFGDTEKFIQTDIAKSRDDEAIFDYMEFQTREPGYWAVYRIVLIEGEKDQWHLTLLRQPLKTGEKAPSVNLPLEITDRRIDAKYAHAITQAAIPILSRTHYPSDGDEIVCVDGYVAQAYVRDTRQRSASFELVGEVYSPPKKSEAYGLVQLGRTLKAYALKQADDTALEASLKLAESLGVRNQ